MTQPSTTSGAVAKRNSSAPSNAAMTTSPAGFESGRRLDTMPAAQIVQSRSVWCVSARPVPTACRVFDRGERRRARAAVVAADEQDVGMGLGDAGGDGAHADFRDELHAHTRVPVGVLRS